ncbi:hypothetical protein BDR26DRAFT_916334 [Obelidium mucronatum]|nr:hypothetical protein BDR26DRAFT_916334 [Obelidium mucronatum]
MQATVTPSWADSIRRIHASSLFVIPWNWCGAVTAKLQDSWQALNPILCALNLDGWRSGRCGDNGLMASRTTLAIWLLETNAVTPAAQKAAIKRRSEMVRDTICANCGIKELQEYHADFQESSSPIRLKRCQSCHDVSYCSHKCQKEAWKPRHKKYCRDVSVLKTGDIVRLRGLKEKSDLNGHLYEIHELNNAAGRWHASWVGGSK